MYICIYVYMYICIYVYISTNYFPRLAELSKIPWVPATFCGHSVSKRPFSDRNLHPSRAISGLGVKSVVFYRLDWGPHTPPRISTTLSRIWPCRALWPGNGAVRQKSRR